MIRERDPFGRALTTLRQQLRASAFEPGQPLAIVDVARALDLSPTPVREALSRLVGEGLVEERRGRGFFVPRLDVGDLVELYGLQDLQTELAVKTLSQAPTDPARSWAPETAMAISAPETEDAAVASELLLERIVAASGNRTLSACHGAVANRLGPARRVEPQVLEGVELETAALAALFAAGDWPGLKAPLQAFHDRRQGAATAVAARLRVRG